VAEGEQSGDGDQVTAGPLDRGGRGTDRGAGVDRVVDDRYAAVGDRVGAGQDVRSRDARGPGELCVQGLGDQLGRVRAADERAADHLRVVATQQVGQRVGVRPERARSREQGVQVEPEVAVVARLVREVAAPDREEI
jgi:hypothetical protein